MKIKNTLLLTVSISLLAACVTPAETFSFEKSRTYNKSYDEVWKKITQYYAMNNISIQAIEKDSGLISAESGGFSDEMASCPSAAIATIGAKSAKLNTFVEDTTPVKVTVNTQFQQTARVMDTVGKSPCNSRGALEKSILDFIGQ